VTSEPVFFSTEADFRSWLAAHHETAPELLVGFWKKGSGKPSIDWPQARDQALAPPDRTPGAIRKHSRQERVLDPDPIDHPTVIEVFGIEQIAILGLGRGDDRRVPIG
jgi:hypothetical protein